MKGISLVFALVCVTIIFLAGLGENVTATTTGQLELVQNSGISNQKILEVVLPVSAIVRLTSGGSYTGELTAFNSTNLTLSASGFSQIVPLAQIRQVDFQGDVWIPNEAGTRRRGRIRGLTQTLVGVPLTALELGDPSNIGTLNLETVLSQEEYERLSSNPERIHVIKELLFETPGETTVKVVAVRR